ncbi:MAG: GtrA family protein [Candidatus ainarchaeum sp.]|nr:GtrA family protein [Candidatus ainarchaeum sp.]MDD3976311.1 GtrA family protein [Candidatus ainarchaeum sp.]
MTKIKHIFYKSLLNKKKQSSFHKIYYFIIDKPFFYRYRRFLKYAVLGLCGTFVDIILLYTLSNILGLYYILAAVISDIARGFTNYNVHKKFAFKYKVKPFSIENIISFFKYYFVNITSVVLVLILMIFFVEYVGLGFILSKLISDLFMNFYKYFGHREFVFGSKNKM